MDDITAVVGGSGREGVKSGRTGISRTNETATNNQRMMGEKNKIAVQKKKKKKRGTMEPGRSNRKNEHHFAAERSQKELRVSGTHRLIYE